ncbi:MAG: SlyX family protein [Sulfuritalea sp.]|jgi:SlyX protein|nr:SlyX family protein [Sulfuritalea sp.]
MEDRITDLEVKLAFAEDLLETLNTTVYRQQERIEQLERSVRDLRQLVLQAIPAEQRSLRDEIPPHY